MAVAGLEPVDGVWLSADEFRERCFTRLLAIKGKPGGIDEMTRLSTPRAKKLSEELMPIAAYVARHRDEDFDIRWLGGNQGYDAEIRSATQSLPEHLEVTIALPENEHLYRENIAETGGSFAAAGIRRDPKTRKVVSIPVAEANSDYLRELEGLARSAVARKLMKKYPAGTSLIVQFRLDRVLLRNEFDEIVTYLRAASVDPEKRFREVILVEPYEFRSAAL
jgi:hypothetical protein